MSFVQIEQSLGLSFSLWTQILTLVFAAIFGLDMCSQTSGNESRPNSNVSRMEKLTIDQLHELRLRIFDNAESLHKEATLLLDNGYYARAFLLAHFTCEELGKIPIVVGAIGRLLKNEAVDWRKVMRRFRDHKAKVDSDDFHQYVFGIELDLLRDSDLKWLEAAKVASKSRVNHKNNSTYVDVQDAAVISPLEQITKEQAVEMLDRAFQSLRAHWQTESMTNPIVVAANKVLQATPKSGAPEL
ncbi:AbiV family abortive infection protein [Thiobaca trueperi]|nr:AbiV family abortive infection protein [Thiobaca trueperi]